MQKGLFTGIVFLFGICLQLHAQDPRFSQFFASPLSLNPALTGRFDGDIRVAGNYRNQWPSINRAFTTTTLSVDFAVAQSLLPEIDRAAVGIMAFTDQQADGALKNTYYGVSAAYHKGLDDDGYHNLTIGFQGVFAQKRLFTDKLTFEDQLRNDGFTGITNEVFDASQINLNYFDLNAGVLFSGVFSNDISYYFGGSVYHVNQPKESFRGGDFILGNRYTVHGGAYWQVGQTTMLHTSALYQTQAGAKETVLGAAIGFNLNGDMEYSPTNFYAGSWYRVNDALIPYIGLEVGSMRFGATYDVTTSQLASVNSSRGGFELSLIYVFKRDDRPSLNCPKF